jgi:GTPase
MKWRLREGQGEAIYEIGVEDSGVLTGLAECEMTASLQTLQQMAYKLGATTTVLRERLIDSDGGSSRKVAEVLVRKVSGKINTSFIETL